MAKIEAEAILGVTCERVAIRTPSGLHIGSMQAMLMVLYSMRMLTACKPQMNE